MTSLSALKKKFLKNPTIHAEYKRLGPEFKLIHALIEKRIQRGLTQTDLARKMQTKQSAIARLESGTYNMTLAFLDRAAKALDTHLVISFSDKKPLPRTATFRSTR